MAKPYKQEKKAYKKAKRKFVSLWKTVGIICLVLTLILAPLNIVLGMFDNTISLLVPGNSFWELENEDESAVYYEGDFATEEERTAAGAALVKQVEAEGASLLMNEMVDDKAALPLDKEAKVSLFSTSSVNIVLSTHTVSHTFLSCHCLFSFLFLPHLQTFRYTAGCSAAKSECPL